MNDREWIKQIIDMAYDAGFDLTFDGNASVTVGSFALTGIGLNSTPFVSKERMAKVIELAANGCLQEEKITQEGAEAECELLSEHLKVKELESAGHLKGWIK